MTRRFDLTSQFLQRHPHLSGFTLIKVLEEMARIINRGNANPASTEQLLAEALRNPKAEKVLVGVTERLQA